MKCELCKCKVYVALLKTNLNWDIETDVVTPGVVIAMVHTVLYRDADKSLARPTSRCFSFDG